MAVAEVNICLSIGSHDDPIRDSGIDPDKINPSSALFQRRQEAMIFEARE